MVVGDLYIPAIPPGYVFVSNHKAGEETESVISTRLGERLGVPPEDFLFLKGLVPGDPSFFTSFLPNKHAQVVREWQAYVLDVLALMRLLEEL